MTEEILQLMEDRKLEIKYKQLNKGIQRRCREAEEK